MTDNNDPVSTPVSDSEELRSIYRSGLQEKVPPRLDRMVMRGAQSEIQKDSALRYFLPWGRSVAFIAAAGLSLALLLDLNKSANREQVSTPESIVQQEFNSEAAESSARMLEIGRTANHRFLGEDPDADDVTLPATSGAPAEVLEKQRKLCGDAQMATPQSWMVCIVQLRADGNTREARAELDRLLLAYPDFVPAQ